MTQRVAITGWPVSHSRSPLIHGYWLKLHGVDGSYDRIAVVPDEAATFYRNLAASGLVGCNVTVPHKEVAAGVCDDLDAAAKAMGAVNTLWFSDDGRLQGSNTDGIGFLCNLDQEAPGWDASSGAAVVIGAGGAARAIIWALLSRRIAPVYIVNRTFAKAQDLATRFGEDSIAVSWDNMSKVMGESRLLVNTTALGMQGQPSLPIDLGNLPREALVTDAVYVPLETPLLKAARERGHRVVDGLGMLLHQAVPGFEKWFCVRPDVTSALRQLVLDDLEASR